MLNDTFHARLSICVSRIFLALLGLSSSVLCATHFAEASPNAGITYHGRIIKPDGLPLETSSVQFKLQIRTPGPENCLLFEELQAKNMLGSKGVFSLTINDGTGSRGSDSGLTLERAFQNRGHLSGLPDCHALPSTYTPHASEGRRFIVYFRDETMSNWEPLPASLINFVPLAIEARSLGGFNASHLLRVTDDGTASGDPASAPILTSSEASELKALAGGTSARYMQASSGGGAALPSYPALAPPASPVAGSIWYDSTDNVIKYFDGTNPVTIGFGGGGGSGTVTSVTAGDGLAGGSFTVSGTISLPDVGTAGTYYKVTTDAKGRVTSGVASLSENDLPTISTSGKVVGSAITSGEIAGTTSINTSGAIQTTGAITSGSHSTRLFDLYDSDNTHRIRFQTPATGDLTSDYELTWPETAGSSGQVLTTNGAGVLSWQAASGSPTGTAGGDLDGTYPNPTLKEIVIAGTGTKISYDAKGRVTSSSTLDAADIPNLDWSKITAGKPTTLLGYGITDAVLNAGGVTSVQSGDDTDKPAPGTAGLVYLAVDTQKIYRDNGSSWDVVASVDAGGGGGGTVTGVTASAPLSSSGGVAPNITISQATTLVDGYLSSADWNTFNSKLGTALNEGEIWVGNGSNQAAAVTPGGDVSMSNVGSFTVTGLRGRAVSAVTPSESGQVLRYDTGITSYVPAFLSLADIRSTTSPFNPMFPSTSCTAAETLSWSSLTDTMTCTTIAIDDSAVTFASKSANAVFAGPNGTSGTPTFRALVENDIPDLSASKITDGILPVARGGTGSTTGSITGTGALTFAAGAGNHNITLTPSGTGHTILNGNVGIGTTAPDSKLEVAGVVHSTSGGFKFPDGTVQTTAADGMGTNNTMIANWPDAIRCNANTGEVILHLNFGPFLADGKYYYVEPASNGSTYWISFNADGSYSTRQTYTSIGECQDSIANIYAAGRAFNFAKGPAGQWLESSGNAYRNIGNVGIGTTAPSEKLEVSGKVKANVFSMGYQRVTNDCGSVSAGAICTATCPGSKKVIGGGCATTGAAFDYSFPGNDQTWTCRTTAATSSLWVYAICVDIE